jgi:AraC family transcriptional regulator of adaptative response/methylated-DNA-[protein]-cysteine methyltransferase
MNTADVSMLNDDKCWSAVLARDAALDGTFVYGVTSTGIYCRPTCPSRRPRRDRVAFFPGGEAAERAGFRACRRCRPAQISERAISSKIRRACEFIRTHADERLTLERISRNVGGSPHHLQRTFSQKLGVSPRQYADACRLGRLKVALKGGQAVTTAIYDAGYGSSSRLYERSDRALGMTPATYRRGGAGMVIRYAMVDSPMGRLLVAATDRGVASVKLGQSDRALEDNLRAEYPAASIEHDDRHVAGPARAILEHLRGATPQLDLPVDVQATAFQWRVWNQLRAIPYGQTKSYSEVARKIGNPGGARAVARACATNPVAVVIPCHRVVQADGGLGGYRWGVERKRALLDQERAKAARSKAS